MPWLKLFPLLLTLLSFLQPLAANASTLLLPLAAAESADVSAAHCDAPGASAFAVVDGTAAAADYENIGGGIADFGMVAVIGGVKGAGEAHPTFGPGQYAGEAISARSTSQRFTVAERAEINRIGKTTGCHTCGTTNPGTKSGNFVPDHQPPSALAQEGTPQQLYPQCINCSREQGLAIARQRRGQ